MHASKRWLQVWSLLEAYKEESCDRLPRDGGMGPTSWLALKSLQRGEVGRRVEKRGEGEERGGEDREGSKQGMRCMISDISAPVSSCAEPSTKACGRPTTKAVQSTMVATGHETGC